MEKLIRKTMIFTFTAALIGLLSNPVVWGQEVPAQGNISDQELRVFAKAYVQVDRVRLALEPIMQNAQDPEQKQNIQQEATGKMEKAVEEQGLSKERYMMIFNTVKGDTELHAKTIKLIEEEQKNS
jgi:hypothetical protein